MESAFVNKNVSETGVSENQQKTESKNQSEPAAVTLPADQGVKVVANLLRITYGIVPIVAGLDKFSNLLTDWEGYLHPGMVNLLPFSPRTFMIVVGIIEIVAGIIVLRNPRIGGIIVGSWLTLIALTLIAGGNYLDVAVRDLVMAIGAFSLARLARKSV